MRAGSGIAFRTNARRAHRRTRKRWWQVCLFLFPTIGWLISSSARADGCFVFKWNKAIDIIEPTQKAIIVHDAGREDLLLQVKYEGPLEEFGWLIPVPSLPKVEKGSMEAFYELSQLTQRQFGTGTKGFATMGVANDGAAEPVKVLEIKTVGAYEVAVLSAQDSGSLARWLKAHDFSLPEGNSEIVDDYIRRGWYFIAAKIELNKGSGFKTVSSTAPRDASVSVKARKAVRSQLSTGELHPLLISFDTPKCIFPLKISALNGKPSEVSLYVLAAAPLLEKFTFVKTCEKLERSYAEWIQQKPQRGRSRAISMQNMRAMSLAMMMYRENSTNRFAPPDRSRPRNWSTEDLNALAKETALPLPDEALGETFYAPEELLHHMRVKSGKIPKSSKVLSRLQSRGWHLTKLVRQFTPEEMKDLEFEPAIPALVHILRKGSGSAAAQLLAHFGDDAMPRLLAACKSTNATERLNALHGFENSPKSVPTDLLLALLKDESPQIRLRAARLANYSDWDQKFTQPVVELLRDPHFEIQWEAAGCLSSHENTNRTSFYLGLIDDPDPNVRMHALGIAWSLNRRRPSGEVVRAALRALKDSSEVVQNAALNPLVNYHQPIPKADLLPLLNSTQGVTAMHAANLLRWGGRVRYVGESVEPTFALSSVEALPLMTNRFGNVRLIGFFVMQENADADAVELTLPLLRDTNSVIRSRAFTTLQAISGQKISDDDPAKWEAWWAANKASFVSRPRPQ